MTDRMLRLLRTIQSALARGEWMLAVTRGHRPLWAGFFACLVVGQMMFLVDPLILGYVINNAGVFARGLNRGHTLMTVFIVVAIFLAVVAVRAAALYVGSVLQRVFAVKLGANLQASVFRHLLRNPGTRDFDSGRAYYMIKNDVDGVVQTVAEIAPGALRIAIVFVGTIVIMLFLNIFVTLIVLCIALILAVGLAFFNRYVQHASSVVRETQQSEASYIVDVLQKLRAVLLLGVRWRATSGLSEHIRACAGASVRFQRLEATSFSCTVAILGCAIAAFLGVGSVGLAHGAISAGAFAAMYAYLMRLFEPVVGSVQRFAQFQRYSANRESLYQFLSDAADIYQPTVRSEQGLIDGVALASVDVTFPGAFESALHCVSMQVRRGDFIVVRGPSGSGKTTLAHVILGWVQCTRGSVRLLAHGNRTLATHPDTNSVAYFPADPVFLRGTVEANLRMSYPYDVARACKYLRLAGLGDLVRTTVSGEAILTKDVSGLSLGERQRLSIARGFLAMDRRTIMIFDEALSGLDATTKSSVFANIRAATATKAVLWVTHGGEAKAGATGEYWLDAGRLRRAEPPCALVG